ncbi:MAG: 16S rRNA (cytidine(1402)-2'-O)-methyltransferase [Dissulfurimicrobium sp.]|uniref:16S rRNA (cytidine(1402)-2'-O)-methyltransferase n=1 Tax=Dissulfurimicrobium TaxID=1769732 RepID=UPI001EDA2D52|nr:16S rRNA (cytidine(1402)-2'-O)-methyltransferase [Dissulfurimicrobium hydrothermale]UKL13696.1 16S rRNA (cytidine(1402)-2'-O)-methyltransferase [Dissulfurimicrobium hydrothermale]
MSTDKKTHIKPGRLYVIATPIGNLKDITIRAIETLARVHLVAAEDTRQARKLLSHLGLNPKLISSRQQNELIVKDVILKTLEQGKDAALVTDAGTPALSDPGARLVAAARKAGFSVIPIPGPSAVTTVLSVAGMPADNFLFLGFLPSKRGERRKSLEAASGLPCTLVLFEAPHRLHELMVDMLDVLGDRKIVIAREITKVHETIMAGHISEIMKDLPNEIKGEITIVAEGAPPVKPDIKGREEAIRDAVSLMLASTSVREAAETLSKATGIAKGVIYKIALEVKKG